MSWFDGTPREYEELGGPPVESDEPEEPRDTGAVPASEIHDATTKDQCIACYGYDETCACKKGNA